MVIAKTLKKSMRTKSKYTLKKKGQTMKKSFKKYLSTKNQIDFGDLEEILRHFKLFFKAVIDIDDKDFNSFKREKYDMKKDKILDKIDDIERKDPILRRIRNTSPEIYTILGYSSTNIPYLELVDAYYNILNKLENIVDEDESLSSDATVVQSLMAEDLVHSFIKKKNSKNLTSIDDDLLDMFRGMSVKSDLDDLENMFKSMKVEF
jgi:hypothetical protein